MLHIPTYEQYMNPTLQALHQLGGSASNQELYEQVISEMGLSDELLSVPHNIERGNQTEVSYRMSWARTYLKKAGYIDNSERAVWSLTAKGRTTDAIDPQVIARRVRNDYSPRGTTSTNDGLRSSAADELELIEETESDRWRSYLLTILTHMAPDAFERLSQRLLRECGFVEVDVTGRTGDGGIDGTGILRLQYLVSFQILFQCKRWQGAVGARELRDFRGAMVGRTDKGLFITTGTFTREAQKEATRDGAPPIDLIDGEQLIDLLKSLKLGVQTEVVEKVVVDDKWFANI